MSKMSFGSKMLVSYRRNAWPNKNDHFIQETIRCSMTKWKLLRKTSISVQIMLWKKNEKIFIVVIKMFVFFKNICSLLSRVFFPVLLYTSLFILCFFVLFLLDNIRWAMLKKNYKIIITGKVFHLFTDYHYVINFSYLSWWTS